MNDLELAIVKKHFFNALKNEDRSVVSLSKQFFEFCTENNLKEKITVKNFMTIVEESTESTDVEWIHRSICLCLLPKKLYFSRSLTWEKYYTLVDFVASVTEFHDNMTLSELTLSEENNLKLNDISEGWNN